VKWLLTLGLARPYRAEGPAPARPEAACVPDRLVTARGEQWHARWRELAGGEQPPHFVPLSLLEVPGWEQYTALLTFFITENDNIKDYPDAARFDPKVDNEVLATVTALGTLIASLDRSAS
jgi:hypothetical protein